MPELKFIRLGGDPVASKLKPAIDQALIVKNGDSVAGNFFNAGKSEHFGWIRAKLFACERSALKVVLAFIKVGNFCPQ